MTSIRRVDRDRLRELRTDSGLSQRDLAAKTDGKCSAAYISLIEQGKAIPSDVMIGRLAAALRVHPDEFSTREPVERAA
jgi:transcriptional regulator with XRE-family HTH domain